MNLGLRGKRALVMGATGGLGWAMATSLAREGVDIVASGRNTTRLDEAARALHAEGAGRVVTCSCDFADAGDVEALADEAVASFGGVDILINNTGGPPALEVSRVPPDVWQAHFHTMVLSVIRLTSRLLPGMRERRWGRILTSTSSGVVQPIPALGISNTLRASLVTWSKTLAGEVAADGVTVNVLVPGRIHTARVDELDRLAAERRGVPVEEVIRESHASIPMGRYGTPEEYANVATFLVSERASYVTGTLIRVDGGVVKGV